jgi:1D-myo-inositol 3-kinase
MPPDFLAIGVVTRDISPEGHSIGGAVTYGARTAMRLGLAPAVVTSAASDLDLESAMEGVSYHVVPSRATTSFENVYDGGNRRQRIVEVADPIAAADLPLEWRNVPLVLLGPLVGELRDDLARSFRNSTVMASMQGWLRQWGDDGFVTPAAWDGREVLPHVGAAICSVEDFEDEGLIDVWKEMVPVLIVTMGKGGARLHYSGRWHLIEPFEAREVDPTGAGDVFATAYLVRYRETSDVLESARFASCVASFCVEAEGTKGIPTRSQVEERLGSMGR